MCEVLCGRYTYMYEFGLVYVVSVAYKYVENEDYLMRDRAPFNWVVFALMWSSITRSHQHNIITSHSCYTILLTLLHNIPYIIHKHYTLYTTHRTIHYTQTLHTTLYSTYCILHTTDVTAEPLDYYIARVGWWQDGSVMAQVGSVLCIVCVMSVV